MADKFDKALQEKAFSSYGEYMEYLCACVNMAMDEQLDRMKLIFPLEKEDIRMYCIRTWK